jgi:hypothetical protein
LRDPDFDRERFERAAAALGDALGLAGDGDTARLRAGGRDGVAFFAATFGLAFLGVDLCAEEARRGVLAAFGVAAGDRVLDFRAEGERERDDALERATGAAAAAAAAGVFVVTSATFSGEVSFAPTDFSSSARRFGDSVDDFFAFMGWLDEVRSTDATAFSTFSFR